MNIKRILVNLYIDIVLLSRVRIFCMTLFIYQQQHKSRD